MRLFTVAFLVCFIWQIVTCDDDVEEARIELSEPEEESSEDKDRVSEARFDTESSGNDGDENDENDEDEENQNRSGKSTRKKSSKKEKKSETSKKFSASSQKARKDKEKAKGSSKRPSKAKLAEKKSSKSEKSDEKTKKKKKTSNKIRDPKDKDKYIKPAKKRVEKPEKKTESSSKKSKKQKKEGKGSTKASNKKPPSDCRDVTRKDLESFDGKGGVTTLTVGKKKYEVYCDITTDGGGWMVFQRRVDGKVNFDKKYGDYEKGFGKKEKEFWLGLKIISSFLNGQKNELRVEMTDWKGKGRKAEYKKFSIGNRASGYEFTVNGYSGNAGDSLTSHNGAKFSASDSDNDGNSKENCAKRYDSGFWFSNCFQANPNGKYTKGSATTEWGQGIIWKTWKKYNYSLKSIEMKFRSAE